MLLLTCFTVDANGSSWTITAAASRRVITDARRETERDAVSTLLRVAQTGELVVDVATAEVALAACASTTPVSKFVTSLHVPPL